MSKDEVKEITLSINSIDNLFLAPQLDPFSEQEVELLGQSALGRVLKKMEPGSLTHRRTVHLTVLLPPDQITPD